MRIAFVGLPIAALLLRGDGHEVVWAGICRREAGGTRRLRRLIGRENVSMLPDLERLAGSVAERKPDLVVSWFWTRKVPASFRAIAPLGAIGVHPSLLPRHRGPDPYFWAIDAGDAVTGVTAHELEDAYDTGAILGRRELAIDPAWNAWTLAKKLDRPSLALLRETVAAFARGAPPPRLVQDESLATEAAQPTDDDLEIRWSDDAARIERRVRATSDHARALAPGEAAVRRDGIAVVRTGDAAVELLRGRVDGEGEDGDERELDAAALAAMVASAR
jgi:methionyl-tRNA formyltransferase